MDDCKAVSLAILMVDAFSRPTTDGVDDVGRAFNSTEAIPQAVTEGVDDTTIRHPWFQPFVQRSTGRVRIAVGFVAVFGEGTCGQRLGSFVLPRVTLPPVAPVCCWMTSSDAAKDARQGLCKGCHRPNGYHKPASRRLLTGACQYLSLIHI